MRCTRCDRLAIPQAVGRLPDGLVVFGWCVSCLEEAGCLDIEVAQPDRTRPYRLRPLPALRTLATPIVRATRSLRSGPSRPHDDRQRLVSAFALVLALWGLVLFLGGLLLRSRTPSPPPSPLGNGSPSLLMLGGGATVAFGLALWGLTSGRAAFTSRPCLKAIQVLAFLTALAILSVGILARSPRNDSMVVVLTSFALAVSAAARWLELRRFRPVSPWGRD